MILLKRKTVICFNMFEGDYDNTTGHISLSSCVLNQLFISSMVRSIATFDIIIYIRNHFGGPTGVSSWLVFHNAVNQWKEKQYDIDR